MAQQDYLYPKVPVRDSDGVISAVDQENFNRNIINLLKNKVSKDNKNTQDNSSDIETHTGNISDINDELDGIDEILQNFAIFRDEKASGTAGGTFTSGSWQTRVLNTTVVNNIDGCSINSNVITIPVGTYLVIAQAPAYMTQRHKIRLYNNTIGSEIKVGGSSYVSNSYAGHNVSMLICSFEVSSETYIILQHRAQTTVSSNGFGVESSFSVVEVYSQVALWKIA